MNSVITVIAHLIKSSQSLPLRLSCNHIVSKVLTKWGSHMVIPNTCIPALLVINKTCSFYGATSFLFPLIVKRDDKALLYFSRIA